MNASSLRVFHVMDSLGEGGAEQNLLTLVRRTPSIRHDLAWLYDDDRLKDAFSAHVDRLVPLRCRHGLDHVSAAFRLASVLRERRPDLVHAKLIRAQLVARLAARLAGNIPVITTWECVSYNERMYIELGPRGRVLKQVTRALDAVSGASDRHFIAVSREVAEYNARKLGVSPSRVTVVYNAIEPDRVVNLSEAERAALSEELGLLGGPVMLSVGRLVDQKNYTTVIRAMPQIAECIPTVTWLIAGGGERRVDLERLARELGVERQVRFLGARPDVPKLLQLADLFVFASHYEGLGIALMEALAAGVPAVASRIPTSLEVADGIDTVRYFAASDPADLASTTIAALRDLDELRPRAKRHAAEVATRFSPETMTAQFMAVVEAATATTERR